MLILPGDYSSLLNKTGLTWTILYFLLFISFFALTKTLKPHIRWNWNKQLFNNLHLRAATPFAVLPPGRVTIIKTVAKAGATDSLTCSIISICRQYATLLLILPLKPDRAIWWWTRPSNFSVPEGTDRSPNTVLSWKQYYPSMSAVGNIQAVLESRGAYRMMPLILQGNLFPLPQSLSVYNLVIHRPICMLLMLPGGSQGCGYKLCFLTTWCSRVGNCGNQQFCFLCSPVLFVDFRPAVSIPEWNWHHCSPISCHCIFST